MFFFPNILRNECTKSVLFRSIEDPLVSATFVFFLSCSFIVLNFSNSPRINEYSTLEMLLSSRALDIISFTEFSFDSINILMYSCFSKRKLSFLPISLAIRQSPPSPPAVPMSGKANAPVIRVPNIVSVEVVKSRNACSECTILRTLRNLLVRTTLISRSLASSFWTLITREILNSLAAPSKFYKVRTHWVWWDKSYL